jgi:hypothetical protein
VQNEGWYEGFYSGIQALATSNALERYNGMIKDEY